MTSRRQCVGEPQERLQVSSGNGSSEVHVADGQFRPVRLSLFNDTR